MEHRKKIRNIILLFVIGCLFLSFVFSIVLLVRYFFNTKKIGQLENEIHDIAIVKEVEDTDTTRYINPPTTKESDYWYYVRWNLMEVNFESLLQKNSDTVGWIQVMNTNINYPVVQSSDNSYYLTHAYDKSENQAGWVYMDYRNNAITFSQNTILYAHSRYDTTMFGSLKNTLSDAWFRNKENHIIRFSTPYENTLWQVFSVYSISKENYYITPTFDSDDDFMQFLFTLKNRSLYDFDVSFNYNDKILTLSTCQDNYGSRIVLHAKLIKEDKR